MEVVDDVGGMIIMQSVVALSKNRQQMVYYKSKNRSFKHTSDVLYNVMHICSVPKMDGNGGPIIIHFWKVFNITPKVD